MMNPTLSRAEVREFDCRAIEDFGIPSIILMENAGRGAAEVLLSSLRSGGRKPPVPVNGRVAVCCGKGNNAGDGFVIARHLDLHGYDVRVLLAVPREQLEGDARINYEIIAKAGLPMIAWASSESAFLQELMRAEWIVDALFGTGLQGPVRPPFDRIIEAINGCGKKVLAVDIPSGLDCDTGESMGPTVRADHTATFVALKKGFLNPSAQEWTGKIHIVSIGTPQAVVANGFPLRSSASLR